MFNYYRFIRSRYSTVLEILERQAIKDGHNVRVINEFDGDDSQTNRITIVVKNDVIIDIYKG